MKARNWKHIPSFEDCYEMSDDGYIRSLSGKNQGIERPPHKKGNSSSCFTLYRKGIKRNISPFKLLAITFLGVEWNDKRFLAMPKDGNFENVTLDNVLLLTGKEVEKFYTETSTIIMKDYLKIVKSAIEVI